jgi:hypothetical protein
MIAYLSFFGPTVSYLTIYKRNHKTQLHSREGTANSSRIVYWAKVTHQLTLSRRYSRLVASPCSLLQTPFVTRDFFVRKICPWTDLFMMKVVCELICSWWEAFVNRFVPYERRSWTEVPLYICCCHLNVPVNMQIILRKLLSRITDAI